jgi:aspartate carbamoyltransferase catalytic subunit
MTPKSPHNALAIKSLLGAELLDRPQIEKILQTAVAFKKAEGPIESPVRGKTVALVFFEPSTRTRVSFEVAAKRLGANTLILSPDVSSTKKGETFFDTARTLEAMRPDVIVLRHPSAGTPFHLDQILNVPVINAGDGFHEHPSQALLDLMTIQEFKGKLDGLRVVIVGDIAHSRVARSNIYALQTMGAKVRVCGPPTLLPPKVENLGVEVFWDLEKAVLNQDVVMLLRIQFERFQGAQAPSKSEYARFFGMNSRTAALCKKDTLIMHPGPMNRGLELSPAVADGPQSVILNQVANGVSVRMALLHLLVGGKVLGGGGK